MAIDKNGFILYKDIISTVKKLNKVQRGELFMTILEYVNDMNPVVNDFKVDLVFEPIKNQLKRDLKKYEGTKEKKSDSGAIGNLKRWNTDLYDHVVKGNLELSEAVKIAKDRKASQCDNGIAPVAVSVSVSDTVTVIDTVSEIATKALHTISNEQFFKDLPNSDSINQIASELSLTPDEVKNSIARFKPNAELTYPNFQKFAFHFKKWLNLNRPKNPDKPQMQW